MKTSEKPILFSTEMVRAILEDRKTKTRRVVKPQPDHRHREIEFENGILKEYSRISGCWNVARETKCPYGEPGTILWVRETWADLRGMGFGNNPETDKPWNFAFKADIKPGSDSDRARIDYGVKWRPSIHMPRVAARLFLKVKSVRVERLQDLSEADALAEGVKAYGPNNCSGTSARIAFAELWDSLNEKRGFGWEVNYWVWIVEFERLADYEGAVS